jgi:hypothetical protein
MTPGRISTVTARRGFDVARALIRAALLALAASASAPAWACGFLDPAQVRRGMMNWVYPDSLHVGTAVWVARLYDQSVISRREARCPCRGRNERLDCGAVPPEFSLNRKENDR